MLLSLNKSVYEVCKKSPADSNYPKTHFVILVKVSETIAHAEASIIEQIQPHLYEPKSENENLKYVCLWVQSTILVGNSSLALPDLFTKNHISLEPPFSTT